MKKFQNVNFNVLVEEPADDSSPVIDPFVLNPKKGGCFGMFWMYTTLLHLPAAPQISLCRRVLGSNPGLLRLWL